MKITGINPTIITSKYDDAIKLFESLGFEIRHHNDIDETVPISTRLKNKDGFTIDINESDKFPHDITLIRINVDNFDEAYKMFKEHGFKNVAGEDNTVDVPHFKGAHMISPSGFNVMVMQHIKK
jgi:beta-lactam-binding protein with PASTA domain